MYISVLETRNYVSEVQRVPAGVPQSSILGLLLYLLFMANIPVLPNGIELFLFADDTAIASNDRAPAKLRRSAQRSLDILQDYAFE